MANARFVVVRWHAGKFMHFPHISMSCFQKHFLPRYTVHDSGLKGVPSEFFFAMCCQRLVEKNDDPHKEIFFMTWGPDCGAVPCNIEKVKYWRIDAVRIQCL